MKKSSAFNFNCQWFKYEEYEINNGIIKPTTNAMKKEVCEYNPFKYFTGNKRFKMPGNQPNIEDQQIHSSFAAILSEKDLLDWVNKFGMPYTCYFDRIKKINRINFPTIPKSRTNFLLSDSVETNRVLYDAEIFRQAIALYNAAKNNSEKDIRDIMSNPLLKYNYDCLSTNLFRNSTAAEHEVTKKKIKKIAKLYDNTPAATEEEMKKFEESGNFANFDPLCEELEDDPIGVAQYYLSNLIKFTTQSVHETIIFEKNGSQNLPCISWEFSSLLSLLYKMLLLDWVQGYSVRKCANKNCNEHFVPSKESNIYCSEECKERAKAQRHRDKLKGLL